MGEREPVVDDTMTHIEMLELWQQKRGALSASMQRRFLDRPEVDSLAKLPRWAVEAAFHRHRLLAQILNFARRRAIAGRPQDPPKATTTERAISPHRSGRIPDDEARAYKRLPRNAKSTIRAPMTRRSKRDGSSLPPLLQGLNGPGSTRIGGAAGGRSTYGSGMARNPGALEARVGERCSRCRAFVPAGAAHDCK